MEDYVYSKLKKELLALQVSGIVSDPVFSKIKNDFSKIMHLKTVVLDKQTQLKKSKWISK